MPASFLNTEHYSVNLRSNLNSDINFYDKKNRVQTRQTFKLLVQVDLYVILVQVSWLCVIGITRAFVYFFRTEEFDNVYFIR